MSGAARETLRAPLMLKAGVLLAATVLTLVGGRAVYRWALESPAFELKSLSFAGEQRATEAELTRLAGLVPGQNLWTLDVEQVAQALAAHPWIRTVDVSRSFPHRVDIRVTERNPVAIAVLADLYLLDDQGVPFKKVTPEDAVNLPLVTGLSRDQYMQDPRGSAARFLQALSVMEAYQKNQALRGERLSEVRLETDGMALVTGDGQDVLLGEGSVDDKLQRLVRVRSELSHRGLLASVIHLDNRTRPGWVAVQLESSALKKK